MAEPRKLTTDAEAAVTYTFEPPTAESLRGLVGLTQDIVVLPPPRWLMSPRIRVHLKADELRFKGHLASFEVSDLLPGEVSVAMTLEVR